MNADRVVALVVVLACIVAMGVSATTLESSLSSDPDEVIDLDFENVPFGNDQAQSIKKEVQTNKDNPQQQVQKQEPQSQRQQQEQEPERGPDEGEGPGDEVPLWKQLLDLLLELLPYLLALLALVAIATALRRYGERILGLLFAFLPQDDGGDAGGVEWVADPRNEIERAWLTMTDRAGIQRPRQMTTAECASAAVAAGLDPDGVETLRSVFENVRYGTQPITDDDARRARESLRRMNLGGEF